MCGIAGFVESSTSASPVGPDDSRALVHRMCDVIRHRGPDDEGVWVAQGVALGMRRLSIIDLSTGPAADPQRGSHGLDRVQRRDLQLPRAARASSRPRATASTRPPTPKSIVHAYEQWGKDAIARLRGMFGLAIWDTRTRTLLRRPRPRRHQAAALRHGRRPPVLRIRAEVAARSAGSAARSRSGRARSLPVVPLHAARRLDLQGRARSCRPATC